MPRKPRTIDLRRWVVTRKRILDRDGWRCRKCGRAGRLEVDHRLPVIDGGDEWQPANLQTLCRPCHFAKTGAENRARRPVPPEVQAWRDHLVDNYP